MMKKQVKGSIENVLNKTSEIPPVKTGKVDATTFDFPLGTRFSMNNIIWLVKKSFVESNAEFREIIGQGNEEVLELRTLRKDAFSDPEFTVLD